MFQGAEHTSNSGIRARQSSRIFYGHALWPGSAQRYNTRKGKVASGLLAVFKYLAAP